MLWAAEVLAAALGTSATCFCTPAMLLRTKEIIDAGREMTDAEVRHEISGILCRCTGYQNIVNAVQSAGTRLRGRTGGGRD
jgi:aerobic-type carbon monoxide dehydrogenase small subunit (CoxS/CutS family)